MSGVKQKKNVEIYYRTLYAIITTINFINIFYLNPMRFVNVAINLDIYGNKDINKLFNMYPGINIPGLKMKTCFFCDHIFLQFYFCLGDFMIGQ